MTFRERVLVAIIAGLLCGLIVKDRADAQGPALAFGRDSTSGAATPINTDGSNALKVVAQ